MTQPLPVDLIVSEFREGATHAKIAERHGVTRQRISQILADAVDVDEQRTIASERAAERHREDDEQFDREFGDRIRAAVASNTPNSAIRTDLGVTRSQLSRFYTRNNIDRRGEVARRPSLRQFNDTDIERALRQAYADGGKRPLTRDAYRTWTEHQSGNGRRRWPPSLQTVESRLGTWSTACARAGVPSGRTTGPRPSRLTVEDASKWVARYIERCKEAGEAPSKTGFRRFTASPSAATVLKVLDCETWADAIAVATPPSHRPRRNGQVR